MRKWALVLIVSLAALLIFSSCATRGTGARTDPQAGTQGMGAQTVGRTQAQGMYIIKSEGVVYNIDIDGSPTSEKAVEAIASALTAFDKTLASLQTAFAAATVPLAQETILDAIKWVTKEKTTFMKESKGAFGVAIHISMAEGAGRSEVDTAGATGETGIPPTTGVDGEPGDGD